MTSYDSTGISLYMMVYDRHMTVYDEKSALLLVMDTAVLGESPVLLLLWKVHAFSSCPALFPAAWLALLNAAHLLRPKGTLGQEQGNHYFKSYKVARCLQAPSLPRVPRRPRPPAPPAPRTPQICVWKSCYIALNHEDVLLVDRSCDGSFAAKMRSQAVDVDIAMKIGNTTFQSFCVWKISN